MQYNTPPEYYCRLHHVRSRFKGDIENVLLFVSTEISKIPELVHAEFREKLNAAIRSFPGNTTYTEKTINNWRTEISALFGFYIEKDNGNTVAGRRALELAEKQDLVETFKQFLYSFQYPGAHLKPQAIAEMIENGVHFKPAQYILKVFEAAEKKENKIWLTKEEVCHCIFNDLRCTRDNNSPELTLSRILDNRKKGYTYDSTGDVVRYAGDILDYMEIANLIVAYDGKKFYRNSLETEIILKFLNSTEWFDGYDLLIKAKNADYSEINAQKISWFEYANRELSATDFETDLLAFIAESSEEYTALKEASVLAFQEALGDENNVLVTKEIGDMGESLVHSHECQRIKVCGRLDLIHLIKRIPTQFAVGYDIQSVEVDEQKRYIEVKTTVSSRPLQFNKIHLTPNEWNTANTTKDRYFVYRLLLSKHDRKLFIIQDPVGLYKQDKITMIPRNGAEISFSASAGKFEELLTWVN